MRSQIESGAELLTRLSGRPSLTGLENTLFDYGLGSTDIVEIAGGSATGKTVLLTQILGKCLLPSYYEATQIKGCNASAVLINTDHHFQTSKLVDIMTDIVVNSDTMSKLKRDMVAPFVHDCLRKLVIIDCYDSEQFCLTLRTLDDMFLSNENVALLAVDSIAGFYWQDREKKTASSFDAYVKKLVELIRRHTSRLNVATIYTRDRDAKTEVDNEEKDSVSLDYRIRLRKINLTFTCALRGTRSTKTIDYKILSTGVKWGKEWTGGNISTRRNMSYNLRVDGGEKNFIHYV